MENQFKESLSMVSRSTLVGQLFTEVVKGTISIPVEGCKSMAMGCATVAGIYGALTAFVNSGNTPQWSQLQVYAILTPFLLLAVSGYLFGTAYLPNVRLEALLRDNVPVLDEQAQWQAVLDRENQLRGRIVMGSLLFWLAFVWAVACVALVRIPKINPS